MNKRSDMTTRIGDIAMAECGLYVPIIGCLSIVIFALSIASGLDFLS